MSIRFAFSSCLVVAPLLAAVIVNDQQTLAADKATKKPSEASDKPASPESVETGQIDKWIKQLDSDQFAKRDAASRQLREAGPQAIAALQRAADGNSPEAASRAFEILKKHLRGGSPGAKQSAKSALESLTASTNKQVAQRAKKLLAEKPAAPPRPNEFLPLRLGPFVHTIRIQIGNVNGDRDIQIDDGTRKVRITENKKDGITVSVTEKVDGKDKTTKYTAKDKAELKQKHPAGYKIYKQYADGFGAIKIGGFGGRIELKPLLPGADKQIRKALEQQERMLKELKKQMEAMQKNFGRRGIDIEDIFKDQDRIFKHFEDAFRGLEKEDDVKKAVERLRKQLEGSGKKPAPKTREAG